MEDFVNYVTACVRQALCDNGFHRAGDPRWCSYEDANGRKAQVWYDFCDERVCLTVEGTRYSVYLDEDTPRKRDMAARYLASCVLEEVEGD